MKTYWVGDYSEKGTLKRNATPQQSQMRDPLSDEGQTETETNYADVVEC